MTSLKQNKLRYETKDMFYGYTCFKLLRKNDKHRLFMLKVVKTNIQSIHKAEYLSLKCSFIHYDILVPKLKFSDHFLY